MKKKPNKILIALIFLLGLSLLLYPLVANQWNGYRQRSLISSYDQAVEEQETAGQIDYEAEWERAKAYNEALRPSILPDSFAVAAASAEDEEYMSCLNITGDGMMGKVEIPKIDITLPIFHTTEEDILQNAAGHLEGSSLPVGGENNHAVISAHRGLPSAALFTDLDKLEKGDHFLLHILDETLCYEVDKISIVEPKDTKDLAVEEGEDLVTLLTCTPYGVNSHRYLVRGHRVPYDPKEIEGEASGLANMSLHTNYLLWVIVGLLITAIFSLVLYRREKKLERKRRESEASADSQGE
ncbi:MAG: class C sortase [Lachnospiraceae bacterium]|jgi:sortase A